MKKWWGWYCFEFLWVLWKCWLGDWKAVRPLRNLRHLSSEVLLWNEWRKKSVGHWITQAHLEQKWWRSFCADSCKEYKITALLANVVVVVGKLKWGSACLLNHLLCQHSWAITRVWLQSFWVVHFLFSRQVPWHICLQCFGAVVWMSGREFSLWK